MNITATPTYPLRARFGELNRSHDLIGFNGDHKKLPRELYGLTDRPFGGYLDDHQRWWPSVGCAPLGTWWALWWTVPDDNAARPGMVKTEVALWPLEIIGQVTDLTSTMQELNGGNPILPISTELLAELAQALLAGNSKPPVVNNLDAWPGLLAALWARLWPEARQAFSARVAVAPPQQIEPATTPWLYAMPEGQSGKWFSYCVISTGIAPESISRAAKWLIGNADELLNELTAQLHLEGKSLANLRYAGTLADNLTTLQTNPNIETLLPTLQILAKLAPVPTAALTQKQEMLDMMAEILANTSFKSIRSLRNIREEPFAAIGMPQSALMAWINKHFPNLPQTEAITLLRDFAESESEKWWQESVRAALKDGFNNRDSRWGTQFFSALCSLEHPLVLRDLATSICEDDILLLAVQNKSPITDFLPLKQNCVAFAWSRLHAWALLHSQTPQVAISEQQGFPSDALAGLTWLIQNMPGLPMIEAAIHVASDDILRLAVSRTKKEAALLGNLDLSQAVWRKLWANHIEAGGMAWPTNINQTVEAQKFLDAALQGGYPKGVISKIAADFADTAARHTDRAKLWQKLHLDDAQALLHEVARLLLKSCEAANPITKPESALLAAMVSCAEQGGYSARVIATLLDWDENVREEQARRMIAQIKIWGYSGTSLGQLISRRHWSKVANDLYKRLTAVWPPEKDVVPALRECPSLLGRLQRLLFSVSPHNTMPAADRQPLIAAVAEIGANLEPDGLKHRWVTAGGKQAQLHSTGTPAEQWHSAATQADNGALNGGVLALVKSLLDTYPNNQDLKAIYQALKG